MTGGESDKDLARKLVGIWAIPPDDVDGAVPSETVFFPSGHFEFTMLLQTVRCERKWWVRDGKLFEESKEAEDIQNEGDWDRTNDR